MVRGSGALARITVDRGPGHALGDGTGREHEIDPHAPVLVEVAGAVVPVAEETLDVGIHAPERVVHAPLLEPRDGLTLRRGDVRRPDELRRVPPLAVGGCDVEIP